MLNFKKYKLLVGKLHTIEQRNLAEWYRCVAIRDLKIATQGDLQWLICSERKGV